MRTILCNIDGVILDAAKATVSVLDRSFLFGDSIYEVVRTHRGRLFGVRRHFERLEQSAAHLGFALPIDRQTLLTRVRDTLAAAEHGGESYVRIVVSRGTASEPSIDPACTATDPLVVVMVKELAPPDPRWRTSGLSARLVDVLRNNRRALDPAIKSGNYLNNILGLAEAKQHGADVALFLNSEGELTESETSNVWLVRDGVIRTPCLAAGILAGITRAYLLEVLSREGLPFEEARLFEGDLRAADEIFLTSTIRDVCAITRLDGKAVGSGTAGPVTLDLAARFVRELDRLVEVEAKEGSREGARPSY
ncbi:MAG TPA: aminotransferase class IV [Planctomycetota bacterium]|nr:aminotransferase class IV [Planctomycetota bacterium]